MGLAEGPSNHGQWNAGRKEEEMNNPVDEARSDSMAILACLSSLTIFATMAESMAVTGATLAASIAAKDNQAARQAGEQMRDTSAMALKTARERMDVLVQNFGDFFNNHDSCSASMVEITAPMYAILKKRKDGVSLDD
jgi:ribulose kinase